MATLPTPSIVFRPSDMVLRSHTDASYLSEPKARSRIGGIHYLGDYDPNLILPPNGNVHALSSILDVVVSSVLEAESAGVFINAQVALPIRATLHDLGYPQPPTPIICDNLTAVAILTGEFPPKRSRAMDMRFHWVRDRIRQGQFALSWLPGSVNLADYFTKVHPASHSQRPGSECQRPSPESQRPGPASQRPGFGCRRPGSESQQTRLRMSQDPSPNVKDSKIFHSLYRANPFVAHLFHYRCHCYSPLQDGNARDDELSRHVSWHSPPHCHFSILVFPDIQVVLQQIK